MPNAQITGSLDGVEPHIYGIFGQVTTNLRISTEAKSGRLTVESQ